MASFTLFGRAHLAALVLTALAALVASMLARIRWAGGTAHRLVRATLIVALVALAVYEFGRAAREGWLSAELLPLQLCDAATALAIYTLLTRKQITAELLYFWSGAGTVLALLTPDVAWDFPHWEFIVYFSHHGLVVVSAVMLTFGLRLAPRPGAPWRVFLITNAYAAVAALINVVLGTNFLYLREKPQQPTLLDAFGPWPVYLLVCEFVALALLFVLDLPFRHRRLAPADQYLCD